MDYQSSGTIPTGCRKLLIFGKTFRQTAGCARLNRKLTCRQREAREQSPEILAFLERNVSAVDLGDIAYDGQAEARSGLAGRVKAGAASKDRFPLQLGYSGAVILDDDVDDVVPGLDG